MVYECAGGRHFSQGGGPAAEGTPSWLTPGFLLLSRQNQVEWQGKTLRLNCDPR